MRRTLNCSQHWRSWPLNKLNMMDAQFFWLPLIPFSVIRWIPTIAQAVWRTCHLQRPSLKRTGETFALEKKKVVHRSCKSQCLLCLLAPFTYTWWCHSCPFIYLWLPVLYGRCANCFDCPCCMHTLSTRATNIPAPLPDDPTKTTMKKAYYLACGFCRWTSRDVGMADKSVGE